MTIVRLTLIKMPQLVIFTQCSDVRIKKQRRRYRSLHVNAVLLCQLRNRTEII